MSTTHTTIAAQMIDPIVGLDTRSCTDLGDGRWEIGDVFEGPENQQVITADDVVTGLYTWAGDTLTWRYGQPDDAEREIARAIVAGHWDTVATRLNEETRTTVGVEIFDLMGQVAAEVAEG